MREKTILIILIAILITRSAVSQINDCLKDFDFVIKKIQADYPGYNDKVTDVNRSQLMLLEKEVRQKITLHPDNCVYYLNDYTDFFTDHHLRVNWIRSEKQQQPEIMEISTYGYNLNVNVDSLHQITKNTTGIEGVWEGFRQKFIVTKDGQKFIGVVVTCDGWKAGQVMYEFEPVNDTVFNVRTYSLIKNTNPYKTKASLHLKGKVIELHDDTRFIRKSDSQYSGKNLITNFNNDVFVNIYQMG